MKELEITTHVLPTFGYVMPRVSQGDNKKEQQIEFSLNSPILAKLIPCIKY